MYYMAGCSILASAGACFWLWMGFVCDLHFAGLVL